MRVAGLDQVAIQAAVASAIEQVRARNAATASKEADSIAIPHELAHLWLINTYWPEPAEPKPDQYGGPGPDWLDEMAAVMAEPQQARDRRRDLFWADYAGDRKASLTDLRSFIFSDHPMAKQARQLASEAGGHQGSTGTTITVVTGDAARNLAESGIGFYLQSLMLSEFLTDVAGGQQVFDPIARAVSSGASLEDWLASEGPGHNLPDTLDGLQALWLRWLEVKAAAAATTSA
jgi:hypothetical protein